MESPPIKRHRSAKEKADVVYALGAFRDLVAAGDVSVKGDVATVVGKLFNVGRATVMRYQLESTASGGHFSDPSPKGRPPTSLPNDSITAIRDFVRDAAHKAQPVSIQLIKEHLEQLGVKVSKATIARWLRKAGLRFGRGKRQHLAHESPGVIRYRAKFLRHLLSNRDGEGLPIKSEVYLDESYVNQNHTRRLTWYDPSSWVSEHTGAGPRYCIFGACSFTNISGSLFGELVPESLQYWPAARQAPKRSVIEDKHEYHGNINADQFKKWFRELCIRCKDELGACEIIMDGAAYHKSMSERVPTKSDAKPVMLEWLQSNGIACHAGLKKVELYNLISTHKPSVVKYESVAIAEEFGHNVSFTPPYHPELQPMELIWAQLKNPIAASARMSMSELGKAIGDVAETKLTDEVFIGAWDRAQQYVR